MTGILELVIASTWDGEAVEAQEVATLRVEPRGRDLLVCVDAPFHGDPPPPGPAGPTPGLWNHEVVELFVAEAETSGAWRYLEVELSPHGHHLVLRLEGVRRVVAQGLPLRYDARIDAAAGRWTGEALVPASWLPPAPHRANAFAIHGAGRESRRRRHLAWSPLPGAEPDFHQPARFPGVDLGGLDLGGVDLPDMDLSAVDLS